MIRIHKEFANSGGKIVAIAMLFFSIALFISGGIGPFIAGFFLLGLGTLMLTTKEGIELDLDINQYRYFNSTFFMRFGKWKPLPNIVKVSVHPGTRSVGGSNYRTGASFKASKGDYIVRLHPENSRKTIIVSRYVNKNTSIEEARSLARHFQVDLLDTEQK